MRRDTRSARRRTRVGESSHMELSWLYTPAEARPSGRAGRNDEGGMRNDEWKAAWMMTGTVLLIHHSSFIIPPSSLPVVMDERADAPFVKLSDGAHRRFGERREVCGADVVFGLRGSLGAG